MLLVSESFLGKMLEMYCFILTFFFQLHRSKLELRHEVSLK